MAPREDLITSAINFLQDPSVASSPAEKRIEFLKSKNLTNEEIEISLARVGGGQTYTPYPENAYPQQQNRGPPRYGYPMNPYGEWQPPPPEPPRRDWRDWFIMATVVGGASYGLWALTQRYVKPLIAPPTPPQLEQDKAAIDEQFSRAFALLDTLSQDTAALKEAEETRTKRLDGAIADVEQMVSDLKAASARRESDDKRIEAEIKGMKDSLPRALDSIKDASEKQLKELSSELASLKLLMGNRMGGGSNTPSAFAPARQPAADVSRSGAASPAAAETSSNNVNGTSNFQPGSFIPPKSTFPNLSSTPASSTTPRPSSSTSFGATGGIATIPSWQRAAANKAKEMGAGASGSTPFPFNAPTSSQQPQPADGADAVAALGAS